MELDQTTHRKANGSTPLQSTAASPAAHAPAPPLRPIFAKEDWVLGICSGDRPALDRGVERQRGV